MEALALMMDSVAAAVAITTIYQVLLLDTPPVQTPTRLGVAPKKIIWQTTVTLVVFLKSVVAKSLLNS